MPSTGDPTLLISDGLALSESVPTSGDEAVVFTDGLGRGTSTVDAGSNVMLLTDRLAQGPAAFVTLGDLKGGTILYKGDQLRLDIEAENTATSSFTDYTVDFTEDGTQIDSITKELGPGATATYTTKTTKSNTGCFTYQANDSNELKVCWMQVRAGDLGAFPRTVYTGATDPSTDLSIPVKVPASEANAQEITVKFKEEGAVIDSETQTISPGDKYNFTSSVAKTSEGSFTYQANVQNANTGISALSNTVSVEWTDDPRGAIALEQLNPSDYLVYAGDTVNFSIYALNTTEGTTVNYDLGFFEGPTEFDDEVNELQGGERAEYTSSRTKAGTGAFTFQARDDADVNRSNTVDVTWMDVRPGDLTASEQAVNLSASDTTSDLSISVEKPDSGSIDVKVRFLERGAEIASSTKTISGGSTSTFSTTVDKSVEDQFRYTAEVIQVDSGLSGVSNPVDVRWYEDGAEFDNIIVPCIVANTGKNGFAANYSVIGPGYTDNDAFLEQPEGANGVMEVLWEDDGVDSLPRDELFRWDNSNWDSDGYVILEIYHSSSAAEHENWVGEDEDYYIGEHYGKDGEDETYDTLVFGGRAYENGALTDLAGFVVGTWR